ncbi:MAG TPA: PilZ domain-containing protein [Candidatus Dormibacteraeota bacterium]|nr:PilZ domain-containing protein [Candidatus Dormibacteraeota bacterium]
MQPERPRARRYPFAAKIELTEMQSETQIVEQTSNLSLYGCQVNTAKALPVGTMIWLRITHQGGTFEAHGKVANIRPAKGLGIVFTQVEGKHQIVLEKWIAELREQNKLH